MTYRLLLWFDMLEEDGKSTERVRGLFSRLPILLKDLSTNVDKGSGINTDLYGGGLGFGFGNGSGSNGSSGQLGSGTGCVNGNGSGKGYTKIIGIKV